MIPADLADTHDRLENWGRWSRDRIPIRRVQSAEGRYRPEGLQEAEEQDRRRAPDPVDVRDALRVYRAIAPPRFPREFALILAARYVHRCRADSFSAYLRRHGIRLRSRDSDAYVLRALYSARAALRRGDGLALRRER